MRSIGSAVLAVLLGPFPMLLSASTDETNSDHNRSWAKLSGTATDIRLEQLTQAAGIPSDPFYQVVQDQHGFLWFATRNGLIRYDGYQHVRYPGLPVLRRMTNEAVPGLLHMDRKGNLWVGTDMLNRFDAATGAFVQVLKPQTDREAMDQEAITAIQDGPEGTLWLAVLSVRREGVSLRQRSEPVLYQVDPARRTSVPYRMDPEITNGKHVAIRSILESPGGQLWLGTSVGLMRFDPSSHTFQHYPHAHPDATIDGMQRAFNALAWDKTGHLWIHMAAGIERFDPETGRFDRFVEARFYEMTSDPSGRLWLWGGPPGLEVFDPSLPAGTALRAVPFAGTQGQPIEAARIIGLDADRQGNMWVSPQVGSPVHRYSPVHARFGSHLPDLWNPNSVSGGDITGFAEDGDGSMWISSNYAGLNRFDPRTNTFSRFRHTPGNPNSVPDEINNIYMDRSGTLWIGGRDGSIGRFDRRTARYTQLTKLPYRITSMFEDRTGRFWVGALLGPVQLVDRRTGAVTPISIGGGYLTYEDHSGNVWFGFAPGLNRLDRRGDVRLIPIAKPEGRNQTALSPLSIHEDSEGVLWVATPKGLYAFDPSTEKAVRYGMEQGLPTDLAGCLLPDDNGNLWVVNEKGISRFDLREKRFYNFNEGDGLAGRNFDLYACHAARDGRLYFGSSEGFNAFYPLDILARPPEPALVLSGLQVNGKEFPVLNLGAARLTHGQNNLTFQFVAPNPLNPERIRYRFKLEGLEKEWAEGTHREARYTDLEPGHYVFRAEASTDGQSWDGQGCTFQFTIRPPWWRTWWAEALELLVVVGLLFSAYELRVGALHRRERSLAALVDQRTAELVEARGQAQTTEQLLTIAKCLPDVLWTMDLSGRFTYASPRVEQTLGWTVEETLKLTFRDITTPFHANKIEQRIQEELIKASSPDYDRNSVIMVEGEKMRRDGTTFWAEVSATFLWSKGNPVGTIGITRDITERRRQENERENLQNQLAHAQKMELVGRLAGGIAHDFNNVMSVIVMYADSALEELRSHEPARDALKAIRDASEKAVSLGRQLMAFSSKQVFQTEILNLNTVISDSLKMVRRLIGEDVNVVFKSFQGLGPVRADRGQLGQVLINLAVNSRDAMPEGGTFTIETATVEFDQQDVQAYPEVKPGPYAMLTVRDTGMGMDKETVGRIFEPFFTTKAVGKGTGLGLSVVYGIVKQSDGFIRVESEPGHGTEFQIHLPVVPEMPKPILETEEGPIEGGSETVLLVEDEPVLRDKVSEELRTAGYHVLTATDGHMALGLAVSDTRPIHLLLTDVVMPELSGIRVAERLLTFRPQMKVLYMSGYPDVAIGNLSESNFIPKPFTKAKLLRRMRDVLG